MLIDKHSNPNINDIVTIKLASGEEIVGRLLERTSDSIVLAKPVQVIMQAISAKELGLMFQSVLGSVSDQASVQFTLSQLAIRPIKTNDEVTRNYIQATTGLLPAGQKPIVI